MINRMGTTPIYVPSIHYLPRDSLIRIFKYLFDQDLTDAKNVCRTWRHLISTPTISAMKFEERIKSPSEAWEQGRSFFSPMNHISADPQSYVGGLGLRRENTNFPKEAGDLLVEAAEALQPGDIYVDIGAGDGNALFEVIKSHPEIQAVGVAKHKPHAISLVKVLQNDRKNPHFAFYINDFLTSPPLYTKDLRTLEGNVSLITDIKAAFRYGLDPALFIHRLGKMLKPGSLAFIDFGYEVGIAPTMIKEEANHLDSRRMKSGSPLLLRLWFHTIKGFDVVDNEGKWGQEHHHKMLSDAGKFSSIEYVHFYSRRPNTVVLRRNGDPIEVDKLEMPEANRKAWDKQMAARHYDDIYTNYIWHQSPESKAITDKIAYISE